MNLFAISGLINAISVFVLGGIVYFKNRKKEINIRYTLFCFFVGLWSFCYFFWQISQDKNTALFWSRGLMAGAIFIPICFFHFVLSLLDLYEKMKRVVSIGYLIFLLFFALNFTPWFINDVEPKMFFKFWPVPGPVFGIFLLVWFWYCLYPCYLLIRDYGKFTGIKRQQIKYVLIAILIGYGSGSTNYFLWYNIPIPPYGNFIVPLFVGMMAYAIIKYRLMDIDLAFRYGLSHFIYALVSIVIFIPLILIVRHSLIGLILLGLFGFLVAPYFYQKLTGYFQPAVLGKKYSYWDELKNFWESKGVFYTSAQLGGALVSGITELMRLKSCSFFVFVHHRKVFVPVNYAGLDDIFDREQSAVLNTIYPEDGLPVYLKKIKRIVTREELENLGQSSDAKEAAAQMEEIKTQVSAPLFVNNQLTGILNLGEKKNRDMFNDRDLKVINELAKMAEFHLSHVSFLENSLFYSAGTAHDLRKPFKSGRILQYFAAIRRGEREAIDNLEGELNNIYAMSEKAVNLSENLDRFLKGEFKAEKIAHYINLVEEICQLHRVEAEKKGVKLKIEAAVKVISVYAEADSVRRILDELLTNSIKYTDRGEITVKVYQENHREVIIEVADTGCGIVEDDQDDIWELFRRHDTCGKAEGSGIGLACAWQLAEANSGRLFLKYSELGKGSSFCLALPAFQEERVK